MRHLEDSLQKNCLRWFRLAYPRELLVHCPNGGFRDAREAAKFKEMGVRAGFPDLFLYHAAGGFHGLAIELKAGKNKQSPLQVEIQAILEARGYVYVVVRNFDEFREVVEAYMAGRLVKKNANA